MGKDGQDQYTTEIVLQGFNSTLTMLDGRGEGGGERDSGGYGGGSRQVENRGRPSSAPAFEPGGMDDDIPF